MHQKLKKEKRTALVGELNDRCPYFMLGFKPVYGILIIFICHTRSCVKLRQLCRSLGGNKVHCDFTDRTQH